MKIINQNGNTIGEYNKIYIVDIIDQFNKKWSRIDGQLVHSSEKIVLGKYQDHDQAQEILKLLMLEPDVFTMPLENYEEDELFLYPTID